MAGIAHLNKPEKNLPRLPEKRGQLSSEKLQCQDFVEEEKSEDLQDEQIEQFLRDRSHSGECDDLFLYGQFLFEKERFKEAHELFSIIVNKDVRAKYQLGVMYFDGLCGKTDFEKGINYMTDIVDSVHPHAETLTPLALYSIGRAYFEGYGVRRSERTAEKYWLLAARDGKPGGSLMAQTVLGMFYSRPEEECYDLKKAHFWHQEATGNGSIESQGALGVMYEFGLGVRKDEQSSFKCYKHASERGNIYATARLAFLYYRSKFHRCAVDTCEKIVHVDDIKSVLQTTDCVEGYVYKGLAIGCFLYGRCLQTGTGIAKDLEKSKHYYTLAAKHDFDIAAWMQGLVAHGVI